MLYGPASDRHSFQDQSLVTVRQLKGISDPAIKKCRKDIDSAQYLVSCLDGFVIKFSFILCITKVNIVPSSQDKITKFIDSVTNFWEFPLGFEEKSKPIIVLLSANGHDEAHIASLRESFMVGVVREAGKMLDEHSTSSIQCAGTFTMYDKTAKPTIFTNDFKTFARALDSLTPKWMKERGIKHLFYMRYAHGIKHDANSKQVDENGESADDGEDSDNERLPDPEKLSSIFETLGVNKKSPPGAEIYVRVSRRYLLIYFYNYVIFYSVNDTVCY